MRYSVDAALVQKRAKCVNSPYDKPDCRLIYERAMNSIQADKPNKNDIVKFFNECESPSNANGYYRECLSIIDSLDDEKFAKSLKEKYIDSVLPYVEDMSVIEKEAGYVDNTGFANRLTTEAKRYIVCDRILDNHDKISKRFNIESFVERSRNKSLDRIVLPCCNMIDTYDLKPHAKMNVCLEEVSYLLQKQNIKYKKEDLVKYVTEYFLNSVPENNVDMMNKYRMVLSENSMIGDNDLTKVRFFTEMEDDTKSGIMKNLDSYMTGETKSTDKFCSMLADTLCNAEKDDLIYNLQNVLTYIRNYMLTDREAVDCIVQSINKSIDNIEENMQNDNWKYTREDIDALKSIYQNEVMLLDNEMSTNPDHEMVLMYIALKDCYNNAAARLTQIADLIYPSYNNNCMSSAEQTMTTESISLKEYKKTRFNHMLNEAVEVDKLINDNTKLLNTKTVGKLELKERIRPLKEFTIENSRTAYNTIDICVDEYSVLDDTDFYKVHDILNEFCKSINESYAANSNAVCYYKDLGGRIEIHLEDSAEELANAEAEHPVDDDEEPMEIEFSDQDKESIVGLQHDGDLIDSIDIEEFCNLPKEINAEAATMSRDRFNLIMEASQYVSSFDENIVEQIVESFAEENNDTLHESLSNNKILKNWKHVEAPLSIQVEAYNLIEALREAKDDEDDDWDDDDWDDDDEDDEDEKKQKEKDMTATDKIRSQLPGAKNNSSSSNNSDKDKDSKDNNDKGGDKKKSKNPFAGIKLNDLKLFVKGIQAKFKDMSSKEKEWCHNVDLEFNRLYKGITNALTNDRREAIIKGSVIPSFSRCVKFAIALAGLGAAFGNPLVPALTAVASLAMSKRLNKKERLLLLDEIEVELEVLDKEIQMAESQDATKKLRKLLMYKKDLQRQYQRIRYNVRIGKDLLPGSTTGMRED